MDTVAIRDLERVPTAEHLRRVDADPQAAVAAAMEPLLSLYAALQVKAARMAPFAAEAFLAQWRQHLPARLAEALALLQADAGTARARARHPNSQTTRRVSSQRES